ncbi:FMN-binding protein, partial [Clostridioides difficile]|nr:FMN-binding protein [Clostridioides difficile]
MKIRNKATNKKKKYVKISIALFFVFICIIIVIVSNLKPENLVVKDIDINNVKNGIYTGSADNNLVKATVSVEVNNGKIQNINILKHDHLLGKPAEKI